jgi:AcrR family transcriptional regulator
MLPNPEASITSIARLLGVSPGTLYNHIPDLRELRAQGRGRQLPATRSDRIQAKPPGNSARNA